MLLLYSCARFRSLRRFNMKSIHFVSLTVSISCLLLSLSPPPPLAPVHSFFCLAVFVRSVSRRFIFSPAVRSLFPPRSLRSASFSVSLASLHILSSSFIFGFRFTPLTLLAHTKFESTFVRAKRKLWTMDADVLLCLYVNVLHTRLPHIRLN